MVEASRSKRTARLTEQSCPECGKKVCVRPTGKKGIGIPKHRLRGGSGWCIASGKVFRKPVAQTAASLKPKRPAPDSEESIGRRRGPCPLCGARIAYDDELRMNEHRFKDSNAECAATDHEYGWFPESVVAGLPRRQRGGGPIPPKELERMRRIVTKVVASRRDAKKAGEQIAAKRAEARRAAIARKNAPPSPVLPAPPAVMRCVACGLEFERPSGELGRRCAVCDPRRSTSVRALRGGLPGLGRRS
jgi:DNA-directed RNA polymerase subunit RPC12/RpoP